MKGFETARIQNTGDYVRLKTAAALSNGKRVLPILVDGANMRNKQIYQPTFNR